MSDKKDLWRGLPAEAGERTVWVVVEVPKGSRNNYEFVKGELSHIKLDRVLHSPVVYNGDYGFIPRTLWEDGEPLDALVILEEPTFPGCVIECRPIAFLEMRDDGKRDDKVILVPESDPHYDNVNEKEDLPPHLFKEISHFFAVYKKLEGKEVEILGWKGAESAWKAIRHAEKIYEEKI